MLKRFTLLCFLFFSTALNLNAQTNNGKITGRVIEEVTQKPIPGANVVLAGSAYGTSTDSSGAFIIGALPPGTYIVKVSSIGYKPITRSDIIVTNSKPVQIDFRLSESVFEIKGVTVKSDYFRKDPDNITSVNALSYEEIRRAPGGFEDVVRTLSALPGVAQADAGRNDLIVRGGAPSENLYIVDGIEIPNINHFGSQGATGGPLSYINLDYVKEVTFSTGGFSSLYGDKISSALKIDLRDGRKDKLGGKATISASQFGFNYEGPVSDNSDFIFSVRRSYLDFIFKAAGFGFVPEYYDALAKYNYKLDNENSISFLYIGAFDNVKYFNNTLDQRYDNSRILGSDQVQYVGGVIFRHLFNNGFYQFIASRNFVDYNTSQKDSLLNPLFSNKSTEAENRVKAELIYKMSDKTEMNFGLDLKLINFKSDVFFPKFKTTFGDSLAVNSANVKEDFVKAAFYVNHVMQLFERFKTSFGVRFDYFNPLDKKLYFSPRFSAAYSIDDLTDITISSGIYYQAPSYIWLAATAYNKKLKEIKADQFVLGLERKIREDAYIKIETYYKKYSDYPASLTRPYLVLANTGAGFAGSDDNFASFGLEPLTSGGKGFARGVELSARKQLSSIPFYGILSLTYNQSKYTALDGIERVGSYDQTWIFCLSGGYKIDKDWEAGVKFNYSTAKPYTPFNSDGSQSVSAYNSQRLSANNSLDGRLDRKWFFEKWTLITYIDIQNIYNNKMSSGVRWNARDNKAENKTSIGLLPTIGVSAEF
jgi:outer membrane receptor for ferrienterochelin and colicin